MRTFLLTAALLCGLTGLGATVGCDSDKDDGPAERAGENIDEAADDIEEGIEDIKDDINDD